MPCSIHGSRSSNPDLEYSREHATSDCNLHRLSVFSPSTVLPPFFPFVSNVVYRTVHTDCRAGLVIPPRGFIGYDSGALGTLRPGTPSPISRPRPALATESGGFFFTRRDGEFRDLILSSATVALRGRVWCGSPSGFAGASSRAPHTSSTELLTRPRTPADWAALRLPEWVFASVVQG